MSTDKYKFVYFYLRKGFSCMTLFERIKELAVSRDKNMKEVATELGFSENLFYRWKTTDPKGVDLQKVADYFNVSVDYLLGRTDNKYMNENQEIDDDILERALNSAMSYDGKGISDADRPIIKNFIKAYLESKTN